MSLHDKYEMALERALGRYREAAGVCRHCGDKKLDWQVYCGAACAAASEARRPMRFIDFPYGLRPPRQPRGT